MNGFLSSFTIYSWISWNFLANVNNKKKRKGRIWSSWRFIIGPYPVVYVYMRPIQTSHISISQTETFISSLFMPYSYTSSHRLNCNEIFRHVIEKCSKIMNIWNIFIDWKAMSLQHMNKIWRIFRSNVKNCFEVTEIHFNS